MSSDVGEQPDPGDGHDPLQTDGGGEEPSEPLSPSLPVVHGGPLLGRHVALSWIDLAQIIAVCVRFGETRAETS